MARYTIDPKRSTVEVAGSSSLHPIRADASGLSGRFEIKLRSGSVLAEPGLTGEVSIPVSRLESGNALVDGETRRRMDAKRHPEIRGEALSSSRVDANHVHVIGTISLRGVTREVEGDLTLEADGDELVLEGSQSFDIRDWGLKPPRLGLVKVHPDVEVTISLRGIRDDG